MQNISRYHEFRILINVFRSKLGTLWKATASRTSQTKTADFISTSSERTPRLKTRKQIPPARHHLIPPHTRGFLCQQNQLHIFRQNAKTVGKKILSRAWNQREINYCIIYLLSRLLGSCIYLEPKNRLFVLTFSVSLSRSSLTFSLLALMFLDSLLILTWTRYLSAIISNWGKPRHFLF